ncbi:MAG: M10 family metallopeptidase C-terminal domain-containing protein [Pseudomonadota bacterium]
MTFSFPVSAVAYDRDLDAVGIQYGTGEANNDFAGLNASQADAARAAFAKFEAVSGLTFTELSGADAGDATLRIAQSGLPATAWGYYPSSVEEGGDAWLGRDAGYYDVVERGGYAWHTIMHEIGHTLGLKHGHDSGGHGALPGTEDSMEFSIMTYRSFVDDPLIGGYSNSGWSYAQSLMQTDIAAIQQMYGANYDYNSGSTVYTWDEKTGEQFINGVGQGAPGGNVIFQTIWDGGGDDVFRFTNYSADLVVDLAPGEGTIVDPSQLAWLNRFEMGSGPEIYASASIYTAQLFQGDTRALIENAVGGKGDDILSGNDVRNVLKGRSGDDTLLGGEGNDRLVGNSGNDSLEGGDGNDVLVGQRGRDELTGGAGDDQLRGGQWADDLNGGTGDDRLSGGGGKDTINGGAGDDELMGGGGRDCFVFEANAGADTIIDFMSGVDLIDVSAFDIGFGALTFSARDGGATVSADELTLTLLDVDPTALTAGDFIF